MNRSRPSRVPVRVRVPPPVPAALDSAIRSVDTRHTGCELDRGFVFRRARTGRAISPARLRLRPPPRPALHSTDPSRLEFPDVEARGTLVGADRARGDHLRLPARHAAPDRTAPG